VKVKEVFHTVIVGGGVSGYAAGVLLARARHRVAVVEGFPWEWWLVRQADDAIPFNNFSGGILYGVPGHHRLTQLAMDVGLPLTSGDGAASFKSMEPGFQVLIPGHWANLYQDSGAAQRELARVFPDGAEPVGRLFEAARLHREKMDQRAAAGSSSAGRDGKTALTAFLDGWSTMYGALFSGRGDTAEKILAGLDHPGLPAEFGRLFVYALSRRQPAEAGSDELFSWLELISLPSCLLCMGGQRGIMQALRASFQKAGGMIFRSERTPQILGGGREDHVVELDRHSLRGQALVIDGPEAEFRGALRDRWPKDEASARPALHQSHCIPWDAIPPGMGGHLVMNLDGGRTPLIVSMAPLDEEYAAVEILSPISDPDDQGTIDRDVASNLERLRLLLRFLPDGEPPTARRTGHFPAFLHEGGFRERLRHPDKAFLGGQIRQRDKLLVTGRGDYLGSALSGCLADAGDLAGRILDFGLV
jgi:hypothetical protein